MSAPIPPEEITANIEQAKIELAALAEKREAKRLQRAEQMLRYAEQAAKHTVHPQGRGARRKLWSPA